MAKVLLLMALCILPALVTAARPARNPYTVEGRVYCDTCRAGFETNAVTPIHGATVRVECQDRRTMEVVYTKEGKTDASGTYKIRVDEDHQDEICDAVLVRSSQINCSEPSAGRDRARVVLTNNNGIVSNTRYANAMGFDIDEVMSGCTQVLQQYQEVDD
ncbi:major pollen allergen Lol p 11-like [Carica papaya]|uniref:major pollen allergen Lol p 11-like n=1 Tax=Carica papaya TaxID=3649 RepID=UPI000B8CD851|nr:major pollen allergen Lol p 11-like [Carica papaya]